MFSFPDALFCFCTDKYHGVILIPEGLVESIPELYALLQVVDMLHGETTSLLVLSFTIKDDLTFFFIML